MAQPSGEELVLRVPESALIPEGASFYEGEDDGRCRVIKADGTRCGAPRQRSSGLCPGHAGSGGVGRDPRAAARKAAASRSARRQQRLLLGISARRAAQPLQASRLRAQERVDDYVSAVVDGPLDDKNLGSVARQQAAIRSLELLYPQVTASVEMGLPDEPDAVQEMGWEAMSRLAGSLLAGEEEVVPTVVPSLESPHG